MMMMMPMMNRAFDLLCVFAELSFQHEYLSNADRTLTIAELLGPIPDGAAAASSTLFRNKCFLLTCTLPSKRAHHANNHNGHQPDGGGGGAAAAAGAPTPYFKDHLRRQIEAGGGRVYEHFEDVPKGKYRNTKLIAPHACATAKYVQCLAADIKVRCG